jgi:hypothetical protein
MRTPERDEQADRGDSASLADGLGTTREPGEIEPGTATPVGDSYGDGAVDDTDDGDTAGGLDIGIETDVPDTTGTSDPAGDLADLTPSDASPLDLIGDILDEVSETLFGEDEPAASSPFDVDPAEVETELDLDLTGDGVVDHADLDEAASPFDFTVDHHDT